MDCELQLSADYFSAKLQAETEVHSCPVVWVNIKNIEINSIETVLKLERLNIVPFKCKR